MGLAAKLQCRPLQRHEEETHALWVGIGGLVVAASLLAALWVAYFLRRERARELRHLSALAVKTGKDVTRSGVPDRDRGADTIRPHQSHSIWREIEGPPVARLDGLYPQSISQSPHGNSAVVPSRSEELPIEGSNHITTAAANQNGYRAQTVPTSKILTTRVKPGEQ